MKLPIYYSVFIFVFMGSANNLWGMEFLEDQFLSDNHYGEDNVNSELLKLSDNQSYNSELYPSLLGFNYEFMPLSDDENAIIQSNSYSLPFDFIDEELGTMIQHENSVLSSFVDENKNEEKSIDSADAENFECFFCKKMLKNLAGLKIHMRLMHPSLNQKKRKLKDTEFLPKKNRKIVYRNDNEYESNEKPIVQCHYDGCSFITHGRLRTHIKREHTKACTIKDCNYKTPNKKRMENHLENHQKKTLLMCTEPGCSFGTMTQSNLNKHKQVKHTKDVLFICDKPLCFYSTSVEIAFARHIKNKHNEILTKDFACTLCNFKTNSEKLLSNHTLKTHETIKCGYEDCEFSATNKCNLAIHRKKHDKKNSYSCTFKDCNFSSPYSYNLKRHLKIHDKSTIFYCEDCVYTTHNPIDLKSHRIIHQPVKKYTCKGCSMKTVHASSFAKHRRICAKMLK